MRISRKDGFTLIETIIAITIIAVMISLAYPRLTRSFGSPIKQLTRNFVLLTKQLHNLAKLKNRTYRIVVQFPDPEKKTPSQYYVESGNAGQLVDLNLYDKYKKSKKEEEAAAPFATDSSVMKKPMEVPSGAKFTSVEIENFDRPITEGKAYIHFFPQGLIERAVIHLSDFRGKDLSLIINPLTGRTDVEDGNISLKDTQR